MKNKFIFLMLAVFTHIESTSQIAAVTGSSHYPEEQSKFQYELIDVLKELEEQYEVSFLFRSEIQSLPIPEKVFTKNVRKEQISLEEKLALLLNPLNITYEKVENNFYLIRYNKNHSANTSASENASASAKVQQFTVSGTITDEETGDPLPGVNVLYKETGTMSNFDGQYEITVTEENAVLIFSYIGYAPQEVNVNGRSQIDIQLSQDVEALSEVVVTALGFRQDSDKLSSTTSAVDNEELLKSGEANVIDALSGKAAGVRISRSSGDPGSGSHIQIRGQSSITGSQQPLIVLDGIPISNSGGGSNTGINQQSRMNDINPDDIERIDILKGASAAALYGSRAMSGVILITTKQGDRDGKINISLRSTYSVDRINMKHSLQKNYGQGTGGFFDASDTGSWGDKISLRSGGPDVVNMEGPYFVSDKGNTFYDILEKNSRETFTDSNFDQLFGNGNYLENSLSLSGGDEKNTFFLSFSDLNQEGIIRNNSDYRRTTLRFNGERRFNDVIKIRSNSTYSRVTGNGIRKGNSTAGMYLGFLRNPADFDISDYKGDYFPGPNASPITNRQRSYRNPLGSSASPGFNNPLWAIHEQPHSNLVNRFISSAQIDVTPVSWLELIARGGVDSYWERSNRFFPPNSASYQTGLFEEDVNLDIEFTMDVMARASFDLNDDFGGSFLTGMNYNNRQFINLGGEIENFILPDEKLYDFSNATKDNSTLSDSESLIRTLGWYNQLQLSAYDMFFLDATARFETASTFGEESDPNFFYPSVGLVWQFSQLPGLKYSDFLSFGKLRANYGEVGKQPSAYQTIDVYSSPNYSDPYGGNLDVALYGNGGYVPSTSRNNQFLEPERKKEIELGTDLRFFKNRLSLGFTYYQNETTNALFSIDIPASSGYTNFYANAGSLENKGVEIDFSYTLLFNENFNWNIYMNWNRNRNTVTDLANLASIDIGGLGGVSNRIIAGQPHGILWGERWERHENGALVLDQYGFPEMSTTEGIIGDPNPDWRGGIGTSFSYKNFSFDMLFETYQGADMAAGTKAVMYAYGTHGDVGNEVTAPHDLLNVNGNIIPAGTTFRGNIEDFGAGPVALTEDWYDGRGGYFSGPMEQFIEDGSWTKLREVSLGYTLNSPRFRQITKLSSIQFTVTGRNLFTWTDFEGVDPETNLSGPIAGRGIDYFNNPGTKSYLFTVRLNY